MTERLRRARTELEDAVRAADDAGVRDSLREVAAAFAEYAAADRRPDRAVFDEHLTVLRRARERTSGDAADRIDLALEAAESYRETLEGD